ncbi:LexA family protein [Bdellovibrio bacteriovorus]|uniref:LexA family protein n=1 Tax=Bdellovibrio bacteriovorus TaxID=959 RepID=UPI0035A72138
MLSSGVSPSYQEIKDHFGLASFNSVQNYLKQLTSKGYIENPLGQKRAIQVLHSASAVQEHLQSKKSLDDDRISPLTAPPGT